MRYTVKFNVGGGPEQEQLVEAPNKTGARQHVQYAAVDSHRIAIAKQRGVQVPGGGVVPNYDAVGAADLPSVNISSIEPAYKHQTAAADELAAFEAAG